MTKIYFVLYRGTDSWNPPYAAGAWLDEAEARRQLAACRHASAFDSCELHGVDDLVTLAAKLDEANVRFVEAEKEIARLRALVHAPPGSKSEAVVQYVLGEPYGWLHHNGHCFPLRGAQTEPDEVAHCVRCGVSYAVTGPIMSDPCPGERK